MMKDENRYLEDNVARLIRAGYGGEARPSRRAGERALQSLVAELRPSRAAPAFPVPILGLLAGILALMAVWLAAEMLGPNLSLTLGLPSLVIGCVLFLNLAFVPIAGIVIVIRRRYA